MDTYRGGIGSGRIVRSWRHRAEFGTKRLSDQLSDYGSSVTHRLQASVSRFRVQLLTFTVRQRAREEDRGRLQLGTDSHAERD
ncbi:MAG: hypothetical protein K0R13_1705 [Propionibacteriaceae bacterium]|nr:hypothetical protein [Propionibacteriaceae bacterium]